MEWLPQNFHFIRPLWLLMFVPIFMILIYVWRRRLSSYSWEAICDKELLPHMLITQQQSKKKQGIFLILLACLLVVFALAGPAWERLPQPVFKKDSALVILLDLSLSMNATDIKPSRLERARYKISDLLKQRQEGQTALMVYAGNAFTVTPLTDDIKTIRSQLSALSPDIMPVPGSNTSGALQNAVGLLSQAGIQQGNILLITDEVAEKYKEVFEFLNEQGYKISILGVGTETGAPIPVASGGFLKGLEGEIVLPKLNRLALKEMAALGGGRYHDLVNGSEDIEYLSTFFDSDSQEADESIRDLQTDVWKEQGPWLLLLLLPLVSLSFRKGILVIVLLPNFIFVDDAMAIEWNGLWMNKAQQAKEYWDAEDYAKAAELFDDKSWKAAAKYKAEDFAAAESVLANSESEHDLYNLGNALARQGKYKEAIAAYDKSLQINPDNEDVLHNKSVVEDALKNQPQDQQEQQQSEQNQQQQESSASSEQQQGDSEQQQSENQDADNNQESQDSQQSESQQQQEQNQTAENSEQQQSDKQAQEQHAQEEQNSNEELNGEQETMQALNDTEATLNEDDQAMEQWLRRIPDDPGGLLKRKFRYQYQQQSRRTKQDEQYW